MSDTGVHPLPADAAEPSGLSQWQRIAFIFTAPSKTFEDIRRGNRSWWLPLILGAIVTVVFYGAIVKKITIQQAVDNQIRMNPRAQDRLAQLSPEQREMNNKITVAVTQFAFLGSPVIGMAGAALVALGLWGTINFVFGGKSTFGSIFAVTYYAWIPATLKALLGTVVIYAGMAPESFNMRNFSPTNLGAFLDPLDTNAALYALASAFDLLTIWTIVLIGMGVAIVAGTKRSSGYITAFGWWGLFTLVSVVWAAFTS